MKRNYENAGAKFTVRKLFNQYTTCKFSWYAWRIQSRNLHQLEYREQNWKLEK